jgi:Outer membrane protein beta-barrel domain
MHSIHRKKVIVFIFLLLALNGFAQEKIRFQPDYDNKRIHFGYYLGFVDTNYLLKFKKNYISPTINNGRIYAITSPSATGIKAGAVVNYYINDYFDLRFSPLTIAIYGRKLLENDSIKHDQVDKAWFEIPVYLKYKSERRMNSRMFIFAGLKYGFETNVVNRKGAANSSFATKTADFSIDYGMGLELFREYFKVTPEVHFSHGMRNMVNPALPSSNFLSYVDRMRTHSVSFFIVFQ